MSEPTDPSLAELDADVDAAQLALDMAQNRVHELLELLEDARSDELLAVRRHLQAFARRRAYRANPRPVRL